MQTYGIFTMIKAILDRYIMEQVILDRYIIEQVISERFKLNSRNFAGLRFTFIKNLSCTVELELIKLPHYVSNET